MREYIQRFLIARNYAIPTRERYTIEIEKFIRFCEYKGYTEYSQIRQKDVEIYVQQIALRKGTKRTVENALKPVRSLFYYLMEIGLVEENPAKNVELKPKKEIPDVMTVQQVNEIIDSFDRTLLGKRDKTIFYLMYSTGITKQELCNIRMKHINFMHSSIEIAVGKEQERLLPINTGLLNVLREYLEEVRPAYTGSKYFDTDEKLFVTVDGNGLNERIIANVLNEAGHTLSPSFILNAEKLRNTFITHMIENGMSMSTLQTVLGHKSSNSLKKFSPLVKNRIKAEFERTLLEVQKSNKEK